MPPRVFEDALERFPLRAYVREKIEVQGLRNLVDDITITQALHYSCGNGEATRTIIKYFNPQNMYGVDASEDLITAARNNPANEIIHFSVRDSWKLSFEDNYFDAVFDLADLHNYSDWRIALQELKRVIKPGGYLFIEDLSAESFEYCTGKLFKALTAHPYDAMLRLDEFNSYLREIGFEIMRFEKINQLGLFKFFRMLAKKP